MSDMRKAILVLMVAGGVVACSRTGGVGFREAEAMLDSARVQEAEYGFVPAADEEGLAAAAEYFEKKGSAEERLAAWSLLGKVQMADDALYRAVVSFEHALAAAGELKDDGARGEICRQLAYAYNASGQHVAAARQLYESYQAFNRASMDEESRRTLLEYGQAWYNFERYDDAATIFNTVLAESIEARDTLTQVRCLQNYSAMLVEMDPVDPALARDMLVRVRDELHYPLGSADWGVLAYAAALMGQDAEAQRCLLQARARVETVSDRNRLHFREYQVASRAGRTAQALQALERVTASGNEEDISALRSAVTLAREDYLQAREALASERLRSQRARQTALLLLLIAVGSTALWYLRARRIANERALAEERAETERYIGIAEELQARLGETSRRLRDTASGRNEVLERLCEQYYVFEGTDKLQNNLLKEVRQAVEGLRNDKKVQARLERSVDASRDGAAAKLRAQLPNCKEEDVRLFVLAASGFSRTAMATLMDKEKGVINNRLWRLKGRIADSGAPDKDLLLSCLE
jgi:hypothetical protein